MITIRGTTSTDIVIVIGRGPFKDKAGALQICEEYWRRSLLSWTGCVDEVPGCVWGLVAPSLMNDSAYLWLITCDIVDDHRFTFVRQSRIVVDKMLNEDFPVIRGHSVVGDDRSRRWLKWLGVTFEEPILGLDGKVVLEPFILRRAVRG